jgi:hypothetical protein
MATTTNYSWNTPDNTAYVKDGASAIRTLGSSVDTTLFTALGGAYPGLRLIKRQTIGAAVSTVTVTNAFNTNFANYRVVISGVVASTGTDLKLQFSAGGSTYFGSTSFDLYSGGTTGFNRSSSANSLFVGGVAATFNEQTSTIDISSPFLSARTSINGTYFGNGYTGYIGGTEGSNTSYTNLTIFPLTGTITGGTISVYGYGAS